MSRTNEAFDDVELEEICTNPPKMPRLDDENEIVYAFRRMNFWRDVMRDILRRDPNKIVFVEYLCLAAEQVRSAWLDLQRFDTLVLVPNGADAE